MDDKKSMLKEIETGIDIENIYKQTLDAVTADPLWRISEADFVTHFLPVFAGEEDNPKKLGDWTKMAGGPGRYVEVFDRNQRTIFKVPPLQVTVAINSNSPALKGITIYSIIENFKRISMGKSALAQKYVEGRLANYGSQTKNNVDTTVYENEWMAIFKRYNIDIKKTQPDAVDESSGDEVIRYDDI